MCALIFQKLYSKTNLKTTTCKKSREVCSMGHKIKFQIVWSNQFCSLKSIDQKGTSHSSIEFCGVKQHGDPILSFCSMSWGCSLQLFLLGLTGGVSWLEVPRLDLSLFTQHLNDLSSSGVIRFWWVTILTSLWSFLYQYSWS